MIRVLLNLPDRMIGWIEPASTPVLTTLARIVFAGVLLMYFINSGLTKIPDGFANLLSPSFNAFAQIFPKGAEFGHAGIPVIDEQHRDEDETR